MINLNTKWLAEAGGALVMKIRPMNLHRVYMMQGQQTRQGQWVHGNIQIYNGDGVLSPTWPTARFLLLIRRTNNKDLKDFRVMWSDALSRRLARKYDLEYQLRSHINEILHTHYLYTQLKDIEQPTQERSKA